MNSSEKLSDKLITVKLRLGALAEELMERSQNNFANHIFLCIGRIEVILAEMSTVRNVEELRDKKQQLLECFGEVENVLLACKVGINFPPVGELPALIKLVKSEMNRAKEKNLNF